MKITRTNYISYMVTPYNQVFAELGYPELDIVEYDDGEWAIIQYHRSPVVPALTPWSHVLSKLRHVPKSLDVFKKYANQLDIEKRHVWDEQAKSEQRGRERQAAEDRHVADFVDRGFKAIRGNDALMQRIARNGIGELNLRRMARHIPNHHYR